MTTKELIKWLNEVNEHYKGHEIPYKRIKEIIKRLEENDERISYDPAIHKKLEKYNKIIQIVAGDEYVDELAQDREKIKEIIKKL